MSVQDRLKASTLMSNLTKFNIGLGEFVTDSHKLTSLFINIYRAADDVDKYNDHVSIDGVHEFRASGRNLREKASNASKLFVTSLNAMKANKNECEKIIEKWLDKKTKAIDKEEMQNLHKRVKEQHDMINQFGTALRGTIDELKNLQTKANNLMENLKEKKKQTNDQQQKENIYKIMMGFAVVIGGLALACTGFWAVGVFAYKASVSGALVGAGAVGVGAATAAIGGYMLWDEWTKIVQDLNSGVEYLMQEANDYERKVHDLEKLMKELNDLIDFGENQFSITERQIADHNREKEELERKIKELENRLAAAMSNKSNP